MAKKIIKLLPLFIILPKSNDFQTETILNAEKQIATKALDSIKNLIAWIKGLTQSF